MKSRIIHHKDNSTEYVEEQKLTELVKTKKVKVIKTELNNGMMHYRYEFR